MKDGELRDIVLQYFYDRRGEGKLVAPKAADLGVEVEQQDIFRACSQLGEQKLLNWKVAKALVSDEDGHISLKVVARSGNINASGVDVVEGNITPATKVEFVQHTNNSTVNITGSTNVIAGNSITGDNNTLTLSGLEKAIKSANATPQKKEEAKTLYRKFLEHPLVSAIVGGAVGLLGS